MSHKEKDGTTYSLAQDPTFYFTVCFFAILTTALPAGLGQPRFLPFAQTVALSVLLVVALRSGRLRPPLTVMISWIVLQYVTLTALTVLAGSQVERAIADGFEYRTSLLAWFFAGGELPRGLLAAPWFRLLELLGVSLGSLFTGGLLGNWFLIRAVNLAGFSTGILFAVAETPMQMLFAVPIWQIMRAASFALLVVPFAEPVATGAWHHSWRIRTRRTLLLLGGTLYLIAVLLEILAAPIWNAQHL